MEILNNFIDIPVIKKAKINFSQFLKYNQHYVVQKALLSDTLVQMKIRDFECNNINNYKFMKLNIFLPNIKYLQLYILFDYN